MRLAIEYPAHLKIRAYTEGVSGEISGLGRVRVEGEDIRVLDVAIFRQKVSGAHSTIEPSALAEFQTERIRAGESLKEWCLWWHSHASMAVFFSGTDTGTIDTSTEFPFLASLVVNKKGESKARLDVFKPFRMSEELDVVVVSPESEEITAACKADIAAKVEEPKYTGYQTGAGFQTGGYMGGRWHSVGPEDVPQRTLALPKGSDDERESDFVPTSGTFDYELEDEYREHMSYLKKRLKEAKRMRDAELIAEVKQEITEWHSWGEQLHCV